MGKFVDIKLSSHFFRFISIFLIGIFLRFFLLTNQSLWWDEGYTLNNSDGASFLDNFIIVRNIFNADKFQPLYYWLLFGVRKTFGDSEFILRGFSALLGIVTLPVIYSTALISYNKRHALWSLSIASFSAFLVYYSQEVRNYSLIILIAALQLYYLSLELFAPDKRNYQSNNVITFSLLTLAGLLSSVQMAVFSISLFIAHYIFSVGKKAWLKWWLITSIFSLPALIYFATLPGDIDPSTVPISRTGNSIFHSLAYTVYGLFVGITFGPPQEELRGSERISALITHLPELLIFCIVLFILVYLLFTTLRRSNTTDKYRKADWFYFSLIGLCLVFGAILALTTNMNWVPRHSSFVILPICILLPSLFCHTTSSARASGPYRLARAMTLLLIIMNIYSSGKYFFDDRYWRDDYRGISQYLISLQENSYTSFLLTGELRILRYYGDSGTTFSGAFTRKIKHNDPSWLQDLRDMSGPSEKIVVSAYRIKNFTGKDLEKILKQDFEILAKTSRFKGFDVYELEKKP